MSFAINKKSVFVKESDCDPIDASILTMDRTYYEQNLNHLRNVHHSQCLFNRQSPIIPGLHFRFDDSGVLHGRFNCNENHQGYDNMVHGGIIAAVIDASMAQCLMGHGIIGYTTDLSVRYKKPFMINIPATLITKVVLVNCGVLYSLECKIEQNHNLIVQASGRFFKAKKNNC